MLWAERIIQRSDNAFVLIIIKKFSTPAWANFVDTLRRLKSVRLFQYLLCCLYVIETENIIFKNSDCKHMYHMTHKCLSVINVNLLKSC